jgi:hypothetical protein
MMDIFLRLTAISIEVILLIAVLGCLLGGVWLTVFDLGVRLKYKKAIAMVLFAVGGIIVVFFITHLIAFYPEI